MAKGQMRSNKETRKPKQAKTAPKTESSFGAQIKQAEGASKSGGKQKKDR
jgi:hypothetical protein